MIYAGLDLYKRFSFVTAVNAEGKILGQRKLPSNADVLVENFLPGKIGKLGLSYETVKQRNPRIIYASGSGFGQHGPYATKPAFDHYSSHGRRHEYYRRARGTSS